MMNGKLQKTLSPTRNSSLAAGEKSVVLTYIYIFEEGNCFPTPVSNANKMKA